MTMSASSKRSARLFLAVVIGLGSIATFSLIAVLAAESRVVRNPATQATQEIERPRASQEAEEGAQPYASASVPVSLSETSSR